MEDIEEQNEERANCENILEMTPLKLEPLKIPTFNGTYEAWPTFSSLFSTLIIKNGSLSDIQKMQYLKSVVTNDAERVIANLHITHDNFKIAWSILCERFDNKRILIENQMNGILELEQVVENSAEELRNFYDKSKLHHEMLKDVSGEQWLIYLLKNKLDDETRILYEELIEDKKINENMEAFFKFLHKRCRVLESIFNTGVGRDDDSIKCFNAYAEAGEDVLD